MSTRLLALAALAFVSVFAITAVLPDDAYAQAKKPSVSAEKAKKTVSADKKSAAKETGQLGNKEFDQDKLPGPLQIGMGVGSIFVMIAVVKWL